MGQSNSHAKKANNKRRPPTYVNTVNIPTSEPSARTTTTITKSLTTTTSTTTMAPAITNSSAGTAPVKTAPAPAPTVIVHKSSIITTAAAENTHGDSTNQSDTNSIATQTLPRLSRQMTKSMGSISRLFHKGKWKRKRRGSLSASFNMNDNMMQVELMNVNVATEEELMTLQGVNRTLANNIINHRALIGGFRKVEDLALVSGMGATKLDIIRPEICATRRRNNNLSRTSSKSPSMESLSDSLSSRMTSATTNTIIHARPIKILNINRTTIFDLMTIPGINQALAARIVSYRERKGSYKTLDELRNIRIGYKRLGAIRMYLTTEEIEPTTPKGNNNNNNSRDSTNSVNKIIVDEKKGHNRSSSYPAIKSNNTAAFRPNTSKNGHNNDPSPPDMTSIFELMSIQSPRPFYQHSFNGTHKELPAYRLATWNMEKLTKDKMANLGVLEVITRTILENGFSIVAMQEICDSLALKKICDELNEPKLARIREWKTPRGCWKYVLHDTIMHYDTVPHQLGILYNASHIDEISVPSETASFAPFQNGSFTQLGIFKVKTSSGSFLLVNTLSKTLTSTSHSYSNGHASHSNSNNQEISDLISSQLEKTQTEGAVIVGHFNSKNMQNGLCKIDDIEQIVLESVPEQNDDFPNIWLTKGLHDFVTDDAGIVNQGLTHLAIPNGWNWGGRVTDSSPFWSTLYYKASCPKIETDVSTTTTITSDMKLPENEIVVPTPPTLVN